MNNLSARIVTHGVICALLILPTLATAESQEFQSASQAMASGATRRSLSQEALQFLVDNTDLDVDTTPGYRCGVGVKSRVSPNGAFALVGSRQWGKSVALVDSAGALLWIHEGAYADKSHVASNGVTALYSGPRSEFTSSNARAAVRFVGLSGGVLNTIDWSAPGGRRFWFGSYTGRGVVGFADGDDSFVWSFISASPGEEEQRWIVVTDGTGKERFRRSYGRSSVSVIPVPGQHRFLVVSSRNQGFLLFVASDPLLELVDETGATVAKRELPPFFGLFPVFDASAPHRILGRWENHLCSMDVRTLRISREQDFNAAFSAAVGGSPSTREAALNLLLQLSGAHLDPRVDDVIEALPHLHDERLLALCHGRHHLENTSAERLFPRLMRMNGDGKVSRSVRIDIFRSWR